MLFVAAPAGALLEDWEEAVAPASPGFFATNVADGVYDIGTYGGEQTYEFIVKSNPAEMQDSMCLIGKRRCGDVTWAGLKFEQYVNTGTYGATIFHVRDYDFGIPNAPGVDTHLVFVSSEAAGTCRLYVNGVYQASVPTAISLSGLVGIGYGAEGLDLSGSFDNFDGVIYGVAIYDRALSADEILAHADAYFPPEITLAGIALFIRDEVDSGNIAPELEESLLVKIGAALAALNRDNPNEAKVAMNDLRALINQVEAQTNKKITSEVAAEIIRRVNAMIAALGG
jgi:hypothetical protein